MPRLPNARSISSNLGRLARLPSAATEGLEANIRELTRLMSLTVTFSVERKRKTLPSRVTNGPQKSGCINGVAILMGS